MNWIEWTYKGHKCSIEPDVEPDNVKYFTYVDGNWAPFGPYDVSRSLVEKWIDAGMPDPPRHNWNNELLDEFSSLTDTEKKDFLLEGST